MSGQDLSGVGDSNFPGLDRRRDSTIDILTKCYSDDLISVDEFERRVESAQDAGTYLELEQLVADLPSEYRRGLSAPRPSPAPHRPKAPAEGSFNRAVSILGERQVTSGIFENGFGSAVAVMGTLDLDLDEATLVGDELVLHVFGLMSEINLTVPKETRVELELTPILADVKLKGQNTPKSLATRTIRVTGMAVMSDIKIRR